MSTILQSPWARWHAWRNRQSRIGRIGVWLVLILASALLLKRVLWFAHGLLTTAIVLSTIFLVPVLVVLLFRWFTQRLLWKVRNRLILTYLLMGLAPVVLFGTLSAIGIYLLAGQYATSMALAKLDQVTSQINDEVAAKGNFALTGTARLAAPAHAPSPQAALASPIAVSTFTGRAWHPLLASPTDRSAPDTPLVDQPPPAWLHPPFRGIVAFHGHLYLCAESTLPQADRSTPVLGSMPLDTQALGQIAKDLGSISLHPGFSYIANEQQTTRTKALPDGNEDHTEEFPSVLGGVLPPSTHFFDTPVYFGAPVSVTSWETGENVPALIGIASRPAVLYTHLFATSARVGKAVRAEFAGVAIFFALLELFALLLAVGLSRTITRSVADLYRATREIDAGNLDHRVRVARHDQLGALATSFNRMASSITDLLLQQREKERLLGELAIAQEVQTTLFPKSPAGLPTFEMHAVCLPARTVGGDYFDFIFRPESELCLAFGDISGKGISAALLMASLHSAVRAFSLGYGSGQSALSPACLLKQINQHLYRSTQSARYATLFIACYDQPSRTLTYANGGHLPPFLLSSAGSVERLCCGGAVVGLLDDLAYSEATVQLESGDLLVAFTDGLTEPENSSEEFGEQRLLEYIQQNRQLPLPLLAERTLKTLQQWIGNREQPDDMTLLLARQL